MGHIITHSYFLFNFCRSDPPVTRTAMDALFGDMLSNQEAEPMSSTADVSEEAKTQLRRYRRELVSINVDPLAWWKSKQHIYHLISPLARRYLSIAGTSVPSERLFSAAGNLVSAKRSCLKSDNVDILLFLNKNM